MNLSSPEFQNNCTMPASHILKFCFAIISIAIATSADDLATEELNFFSIVLNSIVKLAAEGPGFLIDFENLITAEANKLRYLNESVAELNANLLLIDYFKNASLLAYSMGYTVPNDTTLVKFYLYVNNSDPTQRQQLIVDDIDSITNSTYNKDLPLILIASGFTGNATNPLDPTVQMVNSYAQAQYFGIEANVVLIDWGLLASAPPVVGLQGFLTLLPAYVQAVKNVPFTTNIVVQFLTFLYTNHLLSFSCRNTASVHLIGHSLGARVLGPASDAFTIATNKKIKRLTLTEPAGPLYDDSSFNNGQAVFVDAVHTDKCAFGVCGTVAQADFFVGGGGPIQTACAPSGVGGAILNIFAVVVCSHNLGGTYYAASILNQIPTVRQGASIPRLNGYFGEFAQPRMRGVYDVTM